MKILDRLPYFDDRDSVPAAGGNVLVKPFQIVVRISIGLYSVMAWDRRTPDFPAILDTGNNHNLSISRGQLQRWAGMQPASLREIGATRERGQRIPLHAAVVWLHRNVTGERTRRDDPPHPLKLDEGIAIYPDDTGPRLPVLGLRALTNNRLLTTIDTERMSVTIRTPDWRTKLLRWLS